MKTFDYSVLYTVSSQHTFMYPPPLPPTHTSSWHYCHHNSMFQLKVFEDRSQHAEFCLTSIRVWRTPLHIFSPYSYSFPYLTPSGKPIVNEDGKLGWIKPKINWCNGWMVSRKILELEITRFKFYFLMSQNTVTSSPYHKIRITPLQVSPSSTSK